MIMQFLAILVALAVGYVWSARGFFSSLLNLGVVLASGAITLAFYERVGSMLSDASDSNFVQSIAWGAAIIVPFVVCNLILSVVVNLLVRFNAKTSVAIDWAGGAICGLAAGLIVSGFLVIGISQTRLRPDFFDYKGIETENAGSVVRKDLWVPVDQLVVKLYGFTSLNSLSTSEPLAVWRPHLANEGHLQRMAPDEALFKYALRPGDVSLKTRYTVSRQAGAPVTTLVGDNKPVVTTSGEAITGQGYVEGFVVQFNAGAREKGGQIVVGPGSATLVLQSSADPAKTLTLQPIAAISQYRGENKMIGRWRFDSRDMFIGSAGADATPYFGLEFLVPKDANVWVPIALHVRSVRFPLASADGTAVGPAPIELKGSGDRDAMIADNSLLGGGKIENLSNVPSIRADLGSPNSPIRLSNALPEQIMLNASGLSMSVSAGNQILEGDAIFTNKELGGTDVDRSLRVEQFSPGANQAIVTIEVSPSSQLSALNEPAASATGAPALIDQLGQRYDAIGFVSKTRDRTHIRFNPGRPLQGMADAPALSKSRDDQKLYFVFRVSAGVKIKYYVIGQTPIAEFSPNFQVNAQESK